MIDPRYPNYRPLGERIGDLFWDHFGWFIGAFLILLIVVAFFGVRHDVEVHERYMQQCLNDGRKEYECAAMLRRPDSQTTVIPVPVYTR